MYTAYNTAARNMAILDISSTQHPSKLHNFTCLTKIPKPFQTNNYTSISITNFFTTIRIPIIPLQSKKCYNFHMMIYIEKSASVKSTTTGRSEYIKSNYKNKHEYKTKPNKYNKKMKTNVQERT